MSVAMAKKLIVLESNDVKSDKDTIALVKKGDVITVDAEALRIDINVSDEEMAARRENWQPPAFIAGYDIRNMTVLS